NNYRLDDFLDRLHAAGAGAVIIEEETPSSLDSSGEAIFISRQDYSRLRMLDIVTAGSALRSDTLIFDDAPSASYFAEVLKNRYSMSVETRTLGARRFVYVKSSRILPINDLPIGFSVRKLRALERYGFRMALAPQAGGDISWLPELPADKVSALIFERGRNFRLDRALASKIAARFRTVDFEFYPSPAVSIFPPYSVVRGHMLSVAEKIAMTPSAELARYERAARERGVRFFRVTLDDTASIDDNLDIIKALSRKFKKSALRLGPASSSGGALLSARLDSIVAATQLSGLRKAMAFCLALIFPAVLALLARVYLAPMRPAAAFVVFNTAVLLSALLTASLLSSADFLVGLNRPFGVRFLLIISWLAVFPVVFDAAEARDFARKDVKVYHLAAFLMAVAAVAAVLWRSGNDGYAPGLELRMRDALERIFVVRPRWKEILVGQPFLWLAFRRRNRVFLVFGAVAAVSVINTFLHSHAPLGVSLWRSISGIIAGGVIGVAADMAISFLNVKISSDMDRPPAKI
ncbi:MAG: DUF5693 family protein, partial [Endomicrobiia bacterium]|nr:DUF5693 family protein [Endomicrobiia bacterium]